MVDLIAIGSGPACAFFLHRWLERAPADARVLWLERGPALDRRALIERREVLYRSSDQHVDRAPGDLGKPWQFVLARGGSMHNWAGNTPRFLPADFEMRTRYGVGRDWPVSYDDLETYYCDAEDLMGVAGDSVDTPFPRSRPYPTPPHVLSDTDLALKRASPGSWFAMPQARPTKPWGRRPACCSNAVCELCPIDAKFTVVNGLPHVFDDPRVQLVLGAHVHELEVAGGSVTRVHWRQDGREHSERGALVALGGNALYNPVLLKSSGLDHPLLGRRLHEQVGRPVDVHLDGLRGFNGSSIMTMHGYRLYDGPWRSERAGVLVETKNQAHQNTLRWERGRWREKLRLKLIYEDLPSDDASVVPSPSDPLRPMVSYAKRSDYAQRGLDRIEEDLEILLQGLPVESVHPGEQAPSEAHILGTTVMGDTPEDSVIDADLVHWRARNLLVLGSGCFPTGTPANPSLTIAALSLRAADRVWS